MCALYGTCRTHKHFAADYFGVGSSAAQTRDPSYCVASRAPESLQVEIVIGDVSKCLRKGDFCEVDLKAIPPGREQRGDEWVVLLTVDFSPGKVSARVIDCGKATAAEV